MAPPQLVEPRRSATRDTLEARSRRELLLCTQAVVRDLAPLWGDDDRATIVIASPSLGRRDVEMAFDEINERYRVPGIELQLDDEDPKHLRVVFRTAPK